MPKISNGIYCKLGRLAMPVITKPITMIYVRLHFRPANSHSYTPGRMMSMNPLSSSEQVCPFFSLLIYQNLNV